MPIREILATLVRGESLPGSRAEEFFEELLAGGMDPAQIGAALAMIQARSPTVEEIVGGARVMRRHVTAIPGVEWLGGSLVDTCGTGGAPKTFNVSTLAAIVAAGAAPGKIRVAKHGNRSRTGRGSAELLKALGVNVDAPPAVQARCLHECGVCFCFAIHHHPAARHAAGARQALGFPTIFNLLGPLTNPAGARRQLLGVYDLRLAEKVAHALYALGCDLAWVLHSSDGLDELSISAPTHVFEVRRSGVTTGLVDAQGLGLTQALYDELKATDLPDAVEVARSLLAGAPGPKRDMLLLNAAGALVVGGATLDLAGGLAAAAAAIDSGAARRVLEELCRVSREPIA